jgi:hypothetical protein
MYADGHQSNQLVHGICCPKTSLNMNSHGPDLFTSASPHMTSLAPKRQPPVSGHVSRSAQPSDTETTGESK